MGDLVVNLALLTCHDFIFFASQDYGSVARPADIIGNYALMYALNRDLHKVRRLVSGSEPFYDVDLPQMPIYATPATFTETFTHMAGLKTKAKHNWLTEELVVGSGLKTKWRRASPTGFTWNSTGESLLDKMTKDRLNFPKTGVYYKHPPLSTFYFYTVGSSLPNVLRIGKKYTPARIKYFPLKYEIKKGEFRPTCPVTVVDLPEETEILEGSLQTIPPSPVLTECLLDGFYLEARDQFDITHMIPIPNTNRFRKAWSIEGFENG